MLYYNISENLLQFSKNRSESKYGEDDYGLLVNRKYSWKLTPDERIIDIKWLGASTEYLKHGGLASHDDPRSTIGGASSSLGSELKRAHVRVVILTN